MGVKKIALEINRAKNDYIKWLKLNKAENIDCFEGKEENDPWDYYRVVSAFIGEDLYIVYFMIWGGKIKIDFNKNLKTDHILTVSEFYELIK